MCWVPFGYTINVAMNNPTVIPIDVSIILSANPAPWFANSPVADWPKKPKADFKPKCIIIMSIIYKNKHYFLL